MSSIANASNAAGGGGGAVLQPMDILYMSVDQLCAAAWPSLPSGVKDPTTARALYAAPQPPQSDEPTGVPSQAADASSAGAVGGNPPAPPTAVAADGGGLGEAVSAGPSVVSSPTTQRPSSSKAAAVVGRPAAAAAALRLSGLAGPPRTVVEASMDDEVRHQTPSALSVGVLQTVLLRRAMAAQIHNIAAYADSLATTGRQSSSSAAAAAAAGSGGNNSFSIAALTPNAAAVALGLAEEASSAGSEGGADSAANNVSTANASTVGASAEDALASLDVKKDKDAVWRHIAALLEASAAVPPSSALSPSSFLSSLSPATGPAASAAAAAAEPSIYITADAATASRSSVPPQQSQKGAVAVPTLAATAGVRSLVAQYSFLLKRLLGRDKAQSQEACGRDVPLLLTAALHMAALSTANGGACDAVCSMVELLAGAIGGDAAAPATSQPPHMEVLITKVLTPLLRVLPMVLGGRWWGWGGPTSSDAVASAAASFASPAARLAAIFGALGRRGVFDPRGDAEPMPMDITFFHRTPFERTVDSSSTATSNSNWTSFAAAAAAAAGGTVDAVEVPFAKRVSVTFSKLPPPSASAPTLKCFHSCA